MKKIGVLLILFGLYCSIYGQSPAFPSNQFKFESYDFKFKTDTGFVIKYAYEKNTFLLDNFFYQNQNFISASYLTVPLLAIFSPGINYDPYYYSKTTGFDTNKFTNMVLMRAVASVHFSLNIK